MQSEDNNLPCAAKIPFPTKEKAQAAATVDAYWHGTQLRVYKCKHCAQWHLSSS